MFSPKISETCAEHKIAVADDNYEKAKRLQRAQWLRAAILGASDGLLSVTSLMLAVGAAEDGRFMVLSGLAGAVAGACSMAVGEFVSVATQRDIEKATVSHCSSKNSRQDAPVIKLGNTVTLASINEEMKLGETNLVVSPLENIQHGKLISEPIDKVSPSIILEPTLPPVMTPGRSPIMKVLKEDGRGSPAGTLREDDRGEVLITNPYKAAVASALAFLCGSSVPIVPAILVSQNFIRMVVIAVVTSMALALFGGAGAYLGGSPIRMSAVRVMIGGWIAMAITYGLLKPFDSDDKHGNTKD